MSQLSPHHVSPQATFCWALTVWIWPSWPTTRRSLCWRLRLLSPRWPCASSRPSPRTPTRTVRRTRTTWTLWKTRETTPSTGRRCGLAGWDYRGRDYFFFNAEQTYYVPFLMWKLTPTLPLLFQSHALVPGHRLAEDQQRELGLQYRRGLRGEPRPAAFLHQNHRAWDPCSLRRTPQVSSAQYNCFMTW